MSTRDDSRKPRKKEVIKIARKMNIKIHNDSGAEHTKEHLIRAIQLTEGNTPCFKTNVSFCSETICSWHKECQR